MPRYYIHITTEAAIHYARQEFGGGRDWAAEFAKAPQGGGEGRIVLPGLAAFPARAAADGGFETRRDAEAQAARINECLAYENGRRGHAWGKAGADGRLEPCIVVAA